MGMYELSTSFKCPKCRSQIITTTFYTHRITSDDEYLQRQIDRNKHIALHEKAEKYEKIRDCFEKMRVVFENDT